MGAATLLLVVYLYARSQESVLAGTDRYIAARDDDEKLVRVIANLSGVENKDSVKRKKDKLDKVQEATLKQELQPRRLMQPLVHLADVVADTTDSNHTLFTKTKKCDCAFDPNLPPAAIAKLKYWGLVRGCTWEQVGVCNALSLTKYVCFL
jgi:hypothetical protein